MKSAIKKAFVFIAVLSIAGTTLLTHTGCKKQKKEKEIKIGAILPLTGPAASFGQYIKQGIDLAIEEINKSSTVKFSVIYEDSKNQPREAVSAYNKIVTVEKPSVIIAALSSVATALNPLASKTNTIQIYVDVAKPDVTDGVYTFRIYPEANGTAGVIAEFAAKKLEARKAAVIYINDAYGESSLKVFTKKFKSYGGKVVFKDSYQLVQKEFRDIITKLKNVRPKPDVIYLNGYGPAFVKAIRQLKEMNVNIQILADVAMGLPENLREAGDAAESIYFVDGKMASNFIKKFEEKYGKKPSSDAGYAYDAMMILYNIFKENGKFTVTTVRKGLENLKDFPGVMGKISMKKNGDATLEFVIKQVKNGKPVLVKDWEEN